MTDKQVLFVNSFNGNVFESARKVGFSEDYASRMVRKSPLVREALIARGEGQKRMDIATVEEIQREWTRIIRDPEERSKKRLKAGELLAKSMGGFLLDKQLPPQFSITLDTSGARAPLKPPKARHRSISLEGKHTAFLTHLTCRILYLAWRQRVCGGREVHHPAYSVH